jgi:hypothetical protein
VRWRGPAEVSANPGFYSSVRFTLSHLGALSQGEVYTVKFIPMRVRNGAAIVIESWLGYKRDKEVDAIRLRPHPHEFHLYYDI